MKNIFYVLVVDLLSVPALNAQNGLPANPDPNKCYVRCVTPDVYETQTVTVQTRPAYKRLEVVPAQYETQTETVVVREGYTRYEIVPAEFANEQVSYQREQPYNKIATTDASFGSGSERVEVAPKISRWEYSPYEGCKSDDPGDCQVLCWREYPAQFQDIPTQTLSADAAYTTSPAGGRTDTYTKRVVSRAAEVREIPVPQETATIEKRMLVKDESVREIMVDAETTTVQREVLKTKG
ncbi:MAG: OmpA family protein, partial [Bacteroidota bacterium]